MKTTTEVELPEAVLSAITSAVVTDGIAYLRVRFADGLYHLEVLGRLDMHCPTCQCLRAHAEMPTHPVERNVKRSKSWHHG